ncbi:unnamed protein product [Rhizoctonia solani]|uniref:Uncharacterized protein n=1 Tax=Rhizoctonia solani TaxID=456999 RepID=A0A8H3ABB4_9AGAM|nr:unnamed protein product [Rhizoctonia solani]
MLTAASFLRPSKIQLETLIMNKEHSDLIYAESAFGLALAASALAEAAQALSEAAAALSTTSQDVKPPPTINQSLETTPGASESQEADNKMGKSRSIDGDDASSVDANTGNNVHRRDITPEISSNKAIPSRDAAPDVNHSQVQHDIGGQKEPHLQPLDGLLFPGRNCLVLEEEFDALSLILAYATAGKRTICYVPTSGSLFPWKSIISAIVPDRQVRSAISFSGESLMQFDAAAERFASSNDGSVLVLCPELLPRANEMKIHSISDSLIFWGFPSFWLSLPDAIQQSRHTTLILSRGEYLDSTCRNLITRPSFSFSIHPRQSEFNSFGPDNGLFGLRDRVRRIVSGPEHSRNIQIIYKDLVKMSAANAARLGFIIGDHSVKIDTVNKFVARVFLRGRLEDGSSIFKPDGKPLKIPRLALKNLGTSPAKHILETKKGTSVEKIPAVASQNNAPSNKPLTFTHPPGRWHITLQHDADAIPLICYLAEKHPKSVCCISHCHAADSYGDIFDHISKYEVIRSKKKKHTLEEALARFSRPGVQSGLCLLRGNPPNVRDHSSNFKHVKAAALIYWGLPAHDSFLWPSRVSEVQFTHIYWIIPPDQLSTFRDPMLAGGQFRGHPDSNLLNAQGDNSLLQPIREKARLVFASVSRTTISKISQSYAPARPHAYPFSEFVKNVMLRDDC